MATGSLEPYPNKAYNTNEIHTRFSDDGILYTRPTLLPNYTKSKKNQISDMREFVQDLKKKTLRNRVKDYIKFRLQRRNGIKDINRYHKSRLNLAEWEIDDELEVYDTTRTIYFRAFVGDEVICTTSPKYFTDTLFKLDFKYIKLNLSLYDREQSEYHDELKHYSDTYAEVTGHITPEEAKRREEKRLEEERIAFDNKVSVEVNKKFFEKLRKMAHDTKSLYVEQVDIDMKSGIYNIVLRSSVDPSFKLIYPIDDTIIDKGIRRPMMDGTLMNEPTSRDILNEVSRMTLYRPFEFNGYYVDVLGDYDRKREPILKSEELSVSSDEHEEETQSVTDKAKE